jgi:hypothetical protein
MRYHPLVFSCALLLSACKVPAPETAISDASTQRAVRVCVAGQVNVPGNTEVPEFCIDATWDYDTAQPVPLKSGTHAAAVQGCASAGRKLCTSAELLRHCHEGYMPGGYFWTPDTSGTTGGTIYSCAAGPFRAKSDTNAYLCCN